MRTVLRRLPLLAVGATLLGAAPEPSPLAALATLEPGLWSVRAREGSQPAPRQLCLSRADVLLQLGHQGQQCNRFVIANRASEATISYTCPGHGSGRTSLRVETPRLAQIESQGIADRMPFDWTLEARRIGDCSATARAGAKPSLTITR